MCEEPGKEKLDLIGFWFFLCSLYHWRLGGLSGIDQTRSSSLSSTTVTIIRRGRSHLLSIIVGGSVVGVGRARSSSLPSATETIRRRRSGTSRFASVLSRKRLCEEGLMTKDKILSLYLFFSQFFFLIYPIFFSVCFFFLKCKTCLMLYLLVPGPA